MKSLILSLAVAAILAPTAVLARMDGPAVPAVRAYMKATKAPCFRKGDETQCVVASLDQGASIHYPDDSFAVVFMPYQYDDTGNGMDQMAMLFREEGGRWTALGKVDTTQGTSPTDFRFVPGGITYAGTLAGPGDSRSNPRAKARFRLDYGPKGVSFRREDGSRKQ